MDNTSFPATNATPSHTLYPPDHGSEHAAPYFPPIGHYTVGTILVIVGFLGFFENGLVLIVFMKHKQLRSPTNMFIMSLATSDFLMACLGNPLASTSSLANRWLYGKTGCTWEAFIVYFLGLASIYNLMGISLDRYFVIAKPLSAASITHRVAGCFIAFNWFVSFLWAIFPVLGWSKYGLEAAHTSCSVVWQSRDPLDVSYTMTIFVFCLILPVFIMLYSYYHVFMTVRSVSRNGVWDMKSRVARKNLRIEKKMAKTIGAMVGVYLISWTPYSVVSLWAAIGNPDDISVLAGTLPAILAKAAIIWNPIIYVATNKQFRHAFFAIIPCSGLKEALMKKEREMEKQESSGGDQPGEQTVTAPAATHIQVQPANVVSPSADDVETFARTETIVEEIEIPADDTSAPCQQMAKPVKITNQQAEVKPVNAASLQVVVKPDKDTSQQVEMKSAKGKSQEVEAKSTKVEDKPSNETEM